MSDNVVDDSECVCSTEKAEGMFATLIICLPSEHCGGEIVLSHHGERKTYETAFTSKYSQTHLAWYIPPNQNLVSREQFHTDDIQVC